MYNLRFSKISRNSKVSKIVNMFIHIAELAETVALAELNEFINMQSNIHCLLHYYSKILEGDLICMSKLIPCMIIL